MAIFKVYNCANGNDSDKNELGSWLQKKLALTSSNWIVAVGAGPWVAGVLLKNFRLFPNLHIKSCMLSLFLIDFKLPSFHYVHVSFVGISDGCLLSYNKVFLQNLVFYLFFSLSHGISKGIDLVLCHSVPEKCPIIHRNT